jgi:hypothetical protein
MQSTYPRKATTTNQEHLMEPQTISEWIDQTRQLLEDELIDCKAAAIDTVTYQLDDLELQLLREAVQRGKDKTATQTLTVNVRAAGGPQLPARSPRLWAVG